MVPEKMRIGYPCINLTVGCKGDRTFRLKSYSVERLKETVENNLDCLLKVLKFSREHKILFFRITSDLVPFASHSVNTFNWQDYFRSEFKEIGDFVRKNRIRISMHPDQFTLINSVDNDIFKRSCKELAYHAQILDLMQLDSSAKIQIHVGGVYGDKKKSMERFVKRFFEIQDWIRQRIVVENDDKLYNLQDCIRIGRETHLPVLFDVFHHRINSSGESVKIALQLATKTWKKADDVPMVDYSSQRVGGSLHQHAESIDLRLFRNFLKETFPVDFDVMLEIKDKEKSAIEAVKVASHDSRFLKTIDNWRGSQRKSKS
jgi:UV DNA damage endonuclease